MRYSLTGFKEETGVRIFAFEGIADDRTRTPFNVRADLALFRRYGIRVQEMPLMCTSLLERRDEATETREFTFTEADICLYAKDGKAARELAASKRRPPRKLSEDFLSKFRRGETAPAQTPLPQEAVGLGPAEELQNQTVI